MSRSARESEALDALVIEVYRRTGVTLDDRKRTLLSGRVRRRCRALGLEGVDEYWELLRSLDDKAEEVARFVDSVTTHKTSFFRTRSVWEVLAEELRRLAHARGRADVWSAACSSGQEPWSVAILAESVRASEPGFSWSILGTDISPVAVESAARAEYAVAEVAAAAARCDDLPVESSFEVPRDGHRRVVSGLRGTANFRTHSALDPVPRSFDVVLIRNVIIYFNDTDRRRAIDNACSSLRPDGLLVIGESESLAGSFEGLEYVSPCVYRWLR